MQQTRLPQWQPSPAPRRPCPPHRPACRTGCSLRQGMASTTGHAVEAPQQARWHSNGVAPPTDAQQSTDARQPARALAESPRTQQQGEQQLVLYYTSSWRAPRLHCSVCGGAWHDVDLQPVASSSGRWFTVSLDPPPPARLQQGAPALEFVVRGDDGSFDKPVAGGNYKLEQPGHYRLQDGRVARVAPRPCLVVSDLDDTMVGDDAASAAFKAWWEAEAVPHGARLCYNTGRALESFQQLQRDRAGALAEPDVLIAAVGTLVFQRSPTEPGGWRKDEGFAARLDRQWDLDAVREATYRSLMEVGKEHMHFRPPDEQNDHKVTCGVHASSVARVTKSIQAALDAADVAARLITSGHGDWRYLDIVSTGAGKLEALEYVRAQLGFSHKQCVACGDSMNDTLMLGGQSLAVVVGNAQPDLVAWLAEQRQASPAGSPGAERLFSAQRHRAAGIMEGLERFGFK